MRAFKSNHWRFRFQAIRIRSSITIHIPMMISCRRSRFWYKFDLFFIKVDQFWSIFDVFIEIRKNYQLKDQNNWLKDQKSQFISKKSIYFDFFYHFRSISISFDRFRSFQYNLWHNWISWGVKIRLQIWIEKVNSITMLVD